MKLSEKELTTLKTYHAMLMKAQGDYNIYVQGIVDGRQLVGNHVVNPDTGEITEVKDADKD